MFLHRLSTTSRLFSLVRQVPKRQFSYTLHPHRGSHPSAHLSPRLSPRLSTLLTRQFSTHGDQEDHSRSKSQLSSTLKTLSNIRHTLNSAYSTLSTTRYGRLIRLDKPIGTYLLFLPAAWTISLSAPSVLEFARLTALFYSGAVLLRGAGCTINDIWDVDIDKRVARTRKRPIAAGEISIFSAFAFLGAQFTGGLVILTQLNTSSFLIATLSIPLIMSYPLAKRSMSYPQVVLGLAMNWGTLLGSAAATSFITPEALLLYGAGCCWTMVYDTIYAHQDRDDDRQIGIGSTALAFGAHAKPIMLALAAGKFTFLTAAGVVGGLSCPYYIGATAATAHLVRQIATTDLSDGAQCQKAFVSNQTTGALTWLGLMASRLL